MEDKETALARCPFCGGEAKEPYKETNGSTEFWLPRAHHEVWCPLYNVTWNECSGYVSREAAIEAWNRRAAVTDEQFAYAVHDGHLWARMDEDEQEREIARLEAFIGELMACSVPPRFSEQMREKAREIGIEVE